MSSCAEGLERPMCPCASVPVRARVRRLLRQVTIRGEMLTCGLLSAGFDSAAPGSAFWACGQRSRQHFDPLLNTDFRLNCTCRTHFSHAICSPRRP